MTYVLKTGCKAYFDGLRGCIPCKVLSIKGQFVRPSMQTKVRVQFTKTMLGYREGEILNSHSIRIFPAKALSGQRIRPYNVECDNARFDDTSSERSEARV